jgi:hypothetical protein
MIGRDASPPAFRCGQVAPMAMTPARFPVSVIVACIPLANRWQSERWEPVAVEAAVGEPTLRSPPVPLDAAGKRWRFAGHAIELHRSEGEGYFLNTTSADPKVFVMWRLRENATEDRALPPIAPEVVTVSYNEAARLMDGGERVEAVSMPGAILEWMTPFVAEHYKPEPRKKVRRNDPFAGREENGESRHDR